MVAVSWGNALSMHLSFPTHLQPIISQAQSQQLDSSKEKTPTSALEFIFLSP